MSTKEKNSGNKIPSDRLAFATKFISIQNVSEIRKVGNKYKIENKVVRIKRNKTKKQFMTANKDYSKKNQKSKTVLSFFSVLLQKDRSQ